MKKSAAILLFSIAFSFAQAQTTDNQLWTAFQAETDLTKRLTFGLDLEVRFDNDISRLRTVFGQAELGWKFNKYLSASTSYRYGGRKFEELSEFTKAHRLSVYVTGKYKFKKFSIGNLDVNSFTISNRAGYFNQYLVDAPADKVTPQKYFRNKTQLKYDITKKLSTLVYFELFYRFSGENEELDENRFAGGFEYDINKKNSVKLLYIYLTEVNVKPKNKDDRNIISVGYTLKF
ncbi:MAG TPA: DUF2490 domain-containing protein [Chryseolinea sp.]|nr:DUF2490 domain-containing protein [Chryseolinea sp.]HPH45931.1 DUF2490 domain-containing protein [Chryseolinea sp.]HPM29197.1 DUF2490 domain-containing protein [Chryseolinea sp.]